MTPPSRPPAAWKQSLLLGVLLFAVYIVNFRALDSGDTIPASLLPTALLHGDGVYLDRLHPQHETMQYWVACKRGHVVSRYPLAPPLLALPIEAPQVLALDVFTPGWDRDPDQALRFCGAMAKVTAAIIGALTGGLLFLLLRGLGLGGLAWPTTLAAALGSELWCVASQAMWQHGPAALCLTLAMLLLLPDQPSRWRLCLAGLATGCLVCCRALDVVYAAALFLGVVWRWPRKLVWFLPFPLLLGGLLLAYNLWLFGTPAGGQDELEAYNPAFRGVEGVWTGNFWDGLTGTLFSPNRGLFVFTPWALLALLALPFTWNRLRKQPVLLLLTGAFIVNVAMLAKYSSWWGGCCFGPRFLTDATPVLAVLLGLALAWAWPRRRLILACFGVAIVLSVLIQALGAFRYPSTFDTEPDFIDHPEQRHRLWDWGDGELARCLRGWLWPPSQ